VDETSLVELSLYVAVAVSCKVSPAATLALAGPTAIEATLAAVTVRSLLPVTPLIVALIELAPAATPVARPLVETVALVVSLDAQVAVDETSLVEPSL
jgi:hypothetical protein